MLYDFHLFLSSPPLSFSFPSPSPSPANISRNISSKGEMRASRLVLVRRQKWAILWPILAASVNTSLCTTQNCHSTKAMTWKLTRKIQSWIGSSISISISISRRNSSSSSRRREKGKETKIAWLHHQLELALYLRFQSTWGGLKEKGEGYGWPRLSWFSSSGRGGVHTSAWAKH